MGLGSDFSNDAKSEEIFLIALNSVFEWFYMYLEKIGTIALLVSWSLFGASSVRIGWERWAFCKTEVIFYLQQRKKTLEVTIINPAKLAQDSV